MITETARGSESTIDMDEWWRGAVIYQVYPRSFMDTNGDGVGDLPGITQKLDHIASLGVDAVWISPFFKSPMLDYGYDVEDYRAVDPLFGTLDDFDRLLARAHELGLKVMVDMVMSHTSNRHAWFLESRASRDNPKADWYVWAEPRADGMPPNNWLSIFGGVAWEWEPRRQQYYLHNFLKEQPDLNLHNPEVVQALLGEAEFWLRRGVDGFRLDAIDFAMHDRELRDNPVRGPDQPPARGLRARTPYARQVHIHDKAHPEIIEQLLKPLRRLAERYGAVLLGELSGDGQLERAAEYTQGGDRLHFAYTFDLLAAPFTPAGLREIVEGLDGRLADGWACWAFGNHDVARPPTRFGGGAYDPALAKLLPALLCSLRGSVCLYQGEELGLPEADLAYEDIRDPPGVAFWPQFKGRDGARTPLPWRQNAPFGAFSATQPWLPVPDAHLALAVDRQEGDPDSALNRTRRFLRWRREHIALVRGGMRFVEAPDPVLAFTRGHEADAVLCVFNLGPDAVSWRAPAPVEPLAGHGFASELRAGEVRLPGYGAFFGRLPLGREGQDG